MKAARTLGISLRRFEGWEPATTYEYEDGRLVRSVPESEWSPLEAGWMVALAEIELRTCDGCGGDLHETLSTEAEDWAVEPPIRCAKCTRLAMQQDEYAKDKHPHMQALRWLARRRTRR